MLGSTKALRRCAGVTVSAGSAGFGILRRSSAGGAECCRCDEQRGGAAQSTEHNIPLGFEVHDADPRGHGSSSAILRLDGTAAVNDQNWLLRSIEAVLFIGQIGCAHFPTKGQQIAKCAASGPESQALVQIDEIRQESHWVAHLDGPRRFLEGLGLARVEVAGVLVDLDAGADALEIELGVELRRIDVLLRPGRPAPGTRRRWRAAPPPEEGAPSPPCGRRTP